MQSAYALRAIGAYASYVSGCLFKMPDAKVCDFVDKVRPSSLAKSQLLDDGSPISWIYIASNASNASNTRIDSPDRNNIGKITKQWFEGRQNKDKTAEKLYAFLKEKNQSLPFKHSGKWLLNAGVEGVDDLWSKVAFAVASDKLGISAKVGYTPSFQNQNTASSYSRDFTICVYTKDYGDVDDVFRVLQGLCTHVIPGFKGSDFEYKLFYKCDIFTLMEVEDKEDKRNVLVKNGERKTLYDGMVKDSELQMHRLREEVPVKQVKFDNDPDKNDNNNDNAAKSKEVIHIDMSDCDDEEPAVKRQRVVDKNDFTVPTTATSATKRSISTNKSTIATTTSVLGKSRLLR